MVPHTATEIQKVEAVQRRAARWVYRDYSYTSSVTAMMKDLNWRPLDQRRIDSRVIMLYKVTYDLVQSPHPSTSPVILGCQDIHNLFHTDRFPLLKTITGSHFSPRSIIHWNALPAHIPVLPTFAQFSSAACQVIQCLALNTSFCFYLLTILTLFSHCSNSFHPLFLCFYFT